MKNFKFVILKKIFFCSSLALLVSGCANSPARIGMMSDAEVLSSFSRETTDVLCRIYLRGIKFEMRDPTSRLAANGHRANEIITKVLYSRGIDAKKCATPEAISAIKRNIENDARERAIRAATPSSSPSRCVSRMIGSVVHTNCY